MLTTILSFAFVLGIFGLRARKRKPAVKGSVHAWIGIILGGLSVLGHSAMIILIVFVG